MCVFMDAGVGQIHHNQELNGSRGGGGELSVGSCHRVFSKALFQNTRHDDIVA